MSIKRWAILFAIPALLGLNGCLFAFDGSPSSRHQAKQDDKTCRSYGLRSHTKAYDDCREELKDKAQ